jgi:6-pyruvoyltetrahydropterin/6-carboxytetrahydropterin synthase
MTGNLCASAAGGGYHKTDAPSSFLSAVDGGRRESERMFEVAVTVRFSATHHLTYPDGTHERPHAHDWRVQVTYRGREVAESGMLVDFGVVRRSLEVVVSSLRDRDLNQLTPFSTRPPSAENVGRHIAEGMPITLPEDVRLWQVEVEEEAGCVARYYPRR